MNYRYFHNIFILVLCSFFYVMAQEKLPQSDFAHFRTEPTIAMRMSLTVEMKTEADIWVEDIKKKFKSCLERESLISFDLSRYILFDEDLLLERNPERRCNKWELRNAVRRVLGLFGKSFLTTEEFFFICSQLTWSEAEKRLKLSKKKGKKTEWQFDEITSVSEKFKRYFLDETQQAPKNIKPFEDLCKELSYKAVLSFLFNDIGRHREPAKIKSKRDINVIFWFIFRMVVENEVPQESLCEMLPLVLDRFIETLEQSSDFRVYGVVLLHGLIAYIMQVDPVSLGALVRNEKRVIPHEAYFHLVRVILTKMPSVLAHVLTHNPDEEGEAGTLKGASNSDFLIFTHQLAEMITMIRKGILVSRKSNVCVLQEPEKFALFSWMQNKFLKKIKKSRDLCSNAKMQKALGRFSQVFGFDWDHCFSMQYYGGDLSGGHAPFTDEERTFVITPFKEGKRMGASSLYVASLMQKRKVVDPGVACIKITIKKSGNVIVNRKTNVTFALCEGTIEKVSCDGLQVAVAGKEKISNFFPAESTRHGLKLLVINLGRAARKVSHRQKFDQGLSFVMLDHRSNRYDFQLKIPAVICLKKGELDEFYTIATAYPVLCYLDICQNEIRSLDALNHALSEQFDAQSLTLFKQQFASIDLAEQIKIQKISRYHVLLINSGTMAVKCNTKQDALDFCNLLRQWAVYQDNRGRTNVIEGDQ